MAENAIEIQEKPILFSGAMVKAVIEGRKTQTRRVVKPQPSVDWSPEVGIYAPTRIDRQGEEYPGADVFGASDESEGRVCPYGKPGDRLWVRETHYRWGKWVKSGFTAKGRQRWRFSVKAIGGLQSEVRYIDQTFPEWSSAKKRTELGWHKRPAIFMPRWASRLTLEIISVKVERVQEISEADAIAEGTPHTQNEKPVSWGGFRGWYPTARDGFRDLWNSINEKRGFGWKANPWTWAIEFKVLAARERRA